MIKRLRLRLTPLPKDVVLCHIFWGFGGLFFIYKGSVESDSGLNLWLWPWESSQEPLWINSGYFQGIQWWNLLSRRFFGYQINQEMINLLLIFGCGWLQTLLKHSIIIGCWSFIGLLGNFFPLFMIHDFYFLAFDIKKVQWDKGWRAVTVNRTMFIRDLSNGCYWFFHFSFPFLLWRPKPMNHWTFLFPQYQLDVGNPLASSILICWLPIDPL